MSVYIKGMEMPVDCLACRVACDKESYMVIGRPPKCPLAEAPDGDLIGRAETIEAVELMEIFLGERKKNAVIRGIQALPSADAVSREDYHNLLTASEDIDRALREYQAKEEALSAEDVQGDSCDGCKCVGIIEKCEQCRRIYSEMDDLYKGGEE